LLSLWLYEYDWIAFILVPGIYLYYFAVFFAASLLFKRVLETYKLPDWWNYIFFVFSWLALEYVKSTGWVAYTYGSLLYSHYRLPAAMQFSRNFWLQNIAYVLILVPAVFLHAAAQSRDFFLKAGFISALAIAVLNLSFFPWYSSQGQETQGMNESQTELFSEPTVQLPVDADRLNVALIQHNINSWQTEVNTNRQAFERLVRLSRQAERAGAELVVWSETAFVPMYRLYRDSDLAPLRKHIGELEEQLDGSERGRANVLSNLAYARKRYQSISLSHELHDYLSQAQATYLIGTNDYGQVFPDEDRWGLFNSILLVRGGVILAAYHKQRLVPFTETPKWEGLFPQLNELLQSNGFAQYAEGKGPPVLSVPLRGKVRSVLKIYTMICYEDSLPLYWPHRLYAPEAHRLALAERDFDILLSISNDSWSPSPIGGLQHLSSSLSRAVEAQRYFLRGSTSGQTVAVGPEGQILESLPANTPGVLYLRLPLARD
ncbi:MAG: apolipoprotein N-acyltransferase, partial [Spirochaetota bacterium]